MDRRINNLKYLGAKYGTNFDKDANLSDLGVVDKILVSQNLDLDINKYIDDIDTSHEMTGKPNEFDFFVDIDDTICSTVFSWYDGIINILGNNYIFYNGIREFLLFLLKIGNSRIIFYSSGNPERNKLLVKKLVEIYNLEFAADRISIYNTIIMTCCVDPNHKPDENLINDGQGNKKKQIKGACRDINNSVLIDDDRSFCLKGEEFNFIKIQECIDYKNWHSMTNENSIFRVAGLIYLYFISNEKDLVKFMELVLANDVSSCQPLYYNLGLKILREINPSLDIKFTEVRTPRRN